MCVCVCVCVYDVHDVRVCVHTYVQVHVVWLPRSKPHSNPLLLAASASCPPAGTAESCPPPSCLARQAQDPTPGWCEAGHSYLHTNNTTAVAHYSLCPVEPLFYIMNHLMTDTYLRVS